MHRLKPSCPPFEVVDGPLTGRQYRHGVDYEEISAADAHMFEPSEPVTARPRKHNAPSEVTDDAK